jgi:hypothetical protein
LFQVFRKIFLDRLEQMLYSLVERKFESQKCRSPFYGTSFQVYWGKIQTEEGVQMQTIYASTTHFIRHEGNMVDLTEYRRRLALAQGQPEQEERAEEAAREERPIRSVRRGVQWTGVALDCAASLALIVVALSFAAKIL